MDLFFSVPFSIIIAGIGALLAGIFIGGFKKLESIPPRITPQDYIEHDELIIKNQLMKISHKKMCVFLIWIMWLPFGVLVMALNLSIVFVIFYMACIAISSIIYSFSKCPRCGYYFFYRRISIPKIGDLDTGSEKLNFLFGPGYHNVLSNKCLSCGLSLKINKTSNHANSADAKSPRG